MFKKSFNRIIKNPSKDMNIDEMPLVAALTVGKIEEGVEETTLPPLICKSCGGIFTDYKKLKLNEKDNKYEWDCEFCSTKNEILIKKPEQKKEIEKKKELTGEELSLLFKEITEEKGKSEKGEDKGKKPAPSMGDALVAIIDISGSMGGGKLEAVKHSLIETVKDLKVNKPDTHFILIEFTDYVGIYATPKESIHFQDDQTLYNKNNMKIEVSNKLKNVKIGAIGEFGDAWVSRIQQLNVIGWTALGPGLYAGQVMIEEKILSGSEKRMARIILLTDGLANVGMGKVEGVPEKEAEKFYIELADDCLSKGIIIDVIGVNDGGNTLALNVIGKVTDITGGSMVFITKDQIESAMEQMRQREYIARNTILRVFVPDSIELDDVTGTYTTGTIPKQSGAPINLGALDPNREIYLKFKQKKPMKAENVPIQIQMEYLDKNNVKKTRVIRSTVQATDKMDEYSKNYDSELYTNMKLQEASKLMQSARMDEAKGLLSKLQSTLKMPMYAQTKNVGNSADLLESEMDDYMNMEKEVQMQKDSKSFYSAAGQDMNRASLDTRKMKMMKKKMQ